MRIPITTIPATKELFSLAEPNPHILSDPKALQAYWDQQPRKAYRLPFLMQLNYAHPECESFLADRYREESSNPEGRQDIQAGLRDQIRFGTITWKSIETIKL